MWNPSVFYGVLNLIGLPLVWFHACLGWHNWLSLKPWYPRVKPWAFAFAILLPTLALAGYISATLRVLRYGRSEKWVARLFEKYTDQLPAFGKFVQTWETIIWIGTPAMIFSALLVRLLLRFMLARRSNKNIEYRDVDFTRKHEVPIVSGATLLEQITMANVSHASVCGGRGRCSTCRIRVDSGLENLLPPSSAELKVLRRIKAPDDVRLACQIMPSNPISVTALLPPTAVAADATLVERNRGGEEQEIAVLFADIRQFTKLSERQLPYDTAFILNRYFEAMGRAIEQEGGHIDKFIGDGVMALFGVDEPVHVGARRAIRSAVQMSRELQRLNEKLRGELGSDLRIGIGIHSGTAIVGKMGYSRAVGLTAIGDVVNTANRLESLTKEFGAQLIVSQKTEKLARADLSAYEANSVEIRGRAQPLAIKVIQSALDISHVLEEPIAKKQEVS
jgi:adenylate cyclase